MELWDIEQREGAPEAPSAGRRRPWVALLLNIACSPLGHVYAGRAGRGVVLLAALSPFGVIAVMGVLSFRPIAGVFAAHRIDIQHAEVFSTPSDPRLGWISGRALDVFEVRGPEGGAVDRDRWISARGDLRRVLSGEEDLDALMGRRLRASSLPSKPLPALKTKVVIAGRGSRGRGAYVCSKQACLDRALHRRAFQRAFRATVVVDEDQIREAVRTAEAGE